MMKNKKEVVSRLLGGAVVLNTLGFLGLALLGVLKCDGKALVFVDFWGRFTVYSLWFIGYVGYTKVVQSRPVFRTIVIGLLIANILLFLLLAYLDKITSTPDNLIFVDFWGRITVYSVWVIAYEAYRSYMNQTNE
ncbi:MAG: hypothetical protein C4320_01485 [Armatimonadota bacterium]